MLAFIFASFLCALISADQVAFSQDIADSAESEQASTAKERLVAIATRGTPVIDGKVDKVWADIASVQVNKPVQSLLAISKDDMATAKVKLLWDTDHLYLLWNVTDSALSVDTTNDPWETDSIEFFLDQNKKRSSFYQSDDAQYRVSMKGEVSGQGEGFDQSLVKATAVRTKQGYRVEMSIKVDQVKLAKGLELGVELQVNDDHDSQARDAVAKWNHTEDTSWEDTSDFGTLRLK